MEASELAEARELITADVDDELVADTEEAGPSGAGLRSPLRAVLVAVALVLLAALTIGPRACAPTAASAPAPAR